MLYERRSDGRTTDGKMLAVSDDIEFPLARQVTGWARIGGKAATEKQKTSDKVGEEGGGQRQHTWNRWNREIVDTKVAES